MKAIVKYTKEELEKMSEFSNRTLSAVKGLKKEEYFENYNITRGYAHYTFAGKYKGVLVERLGHVPTEDEIIILVDSGFSHFGAWCNISGDYFEGKVHTD